MPVSVDYQGLLNLLRHHDGRLLPFGVRSPELAADPRRVVAAVRAAIDAANLAAVERTPADATWCSPGDLAGPEVRAELAKGQLTEDEVRLWFGDFEQGLAGMDVTVGPLDVGSRSAPDLDSWLELPPAVTAFLSFTAEVNGRHRTTPASVVDETADALAAWSRLPGATTLAWRGATSFVTPPGSAAEELRMGAALDEQYGLLQLTTHPRRARGVDFTFGAKGSLQVVDETRPAADCLPDLLAGMRILAAHVDYAWVRRATPTVANERDTSFVLGRPPTDIEEVASGRRARHLLARYAVDAYVAQILTSAHLAQAGALDSYIVEDLGADRYLVVAHDPEPWLAGPNPEPEIIERARAELRGALLTREIVAANPWTG